MKEYVEIYNLTSNRFRVTYNNQYTNSQYTNNQHNNNNYDNNMNLTMMKTVI